MSSQLSPSWTPIQVRNATQGTHPSTVYRMNLQNGMRPMPAGSDMKVRTMGSTRLKKTVAVPHLANHSSAISRWWCRRSTYLPQRSMNGRPPYNPAQ